MMGEDDPDPLAQWYQETIPRLTAADVVVDFGPVGPRDRTEGPDFISVKLVEGADSEDLDDVLGYGQYLILSAYLSDVGELIVDITYPGSFELYFDGVM